MYKTYFIKRNELYEIVWNKPMVKIAEEYGVSDKAIAKICEKLNIPVPGVGYWRKIETEHKVFQTPLPELKPGDKYEYELKVKINEEKELSDKYRLLIEQEENPNNRIVVKDKMIKGHPLINQARLLLIAQGKDFNGMLRIIRGDALNVSVSPQNLKRALRILSTLIIELERRGFSVKAETNYLGRPKTVIYFDDQDIEIDLRELTKYTRIKKERNFYNNKVDEYERMLIPTGVLQFEIKNFWDNGMTRIVRDNKNKKLEDQLNYFIICLYRVLNYEVKRQKIWEEERKQSEEKQRIKEQVEIEKRKELKKTERLFTMAEEWEKIQIVKRFLNEAEEKLKQSNQLNEDNIKWLKWAKDKIQEYEILNLSTCTT